MKKLVFLILLVTVGNFLGADDFFKVKEKIINTSRFRIASFYITPLLTVENLGYTSNIYAYENIAEPDWTADLGLDISLAKILAKRFILLVNEHPYYSFYLKNEAERAFNNRFQFYLYTYLGRLNLNYKMEINYISSRPTSEFGARVRTRSRSDTISLDIGRHDNFFMNVYVGWKEIDFKDERYLADYNLGDVLNRQERQAGVNLNKIIFSNTRLFLNYEYFDYRFANLADRDGDGSLVLVGLGFPEIGRVTGTIRLGYKFYRPGNPLFENYSAPFGSGRVSLTVFRRLRLHLNYLLDNFFSFYQPDQYYQEQSIEAGFDYYLSRNLKLGYHYSYGILAFKTLKDSLEKRRDHFRRSRFFVGLRIFKDVGIGLEYSRYRADSDRFEFIRSYDFIGGYITHEF